MKYKVGDRVKVKSLDWYNENKTIHGSILLGNAIFGSKQSLYCGCELTIRFVTDDRYYVIENDYYWTDEMFEGLVEEGTQSKEMLKENAKHYWKMITGDSKPKFKVGDKVMLDLYPCVVTGVEWKGNSKYVGYVYTVRGTDFGKIVKETDLVFDESTVPNTNEIIQLIKNDWNNFKDRYNIPDDYHFVDKNGNEINISEIVLEKKKEYPKTYEDCSLINGAEGRISLSIIGKFTKLINARNAYWRIAGKEMGLGKPWKPDWTNQKLPKYCIAGVEGQIKTAERYIVNTILAFPTVEMRDAFYENFKELIEECKELL